VTRKSQDGPGSADQFGALVARIVVAFFASRMSQMNTGMQEFGEVGAWLISAS
jgi:hypothetical protein